MNIIATWKFEKGKQKKSILDLISKIYASLKMPNQIMDYSMDKGCYPAFLTANSLFYFLYFQLLERERERKQIHFTLNITWKKRELKKSYEAYSLLR